MQFDEEQEKFIEAFETVSSWPVQKRNLDKSISDSICSDVTSISSDFYTLRQVTKFAFIIYFLQKPEQF